MATVSDTKPAKPYQEFPLTAHQNGQWCKKIKGKVWFFGVWSDPDAALRKYLDEVDEIQAERDPGRNRVAEIQADSPTPLDLLQITAQATAMKCCVWRS